MTVSAHNSGAPPGPDACVVGVDFGTLSGRALVVRVRDGAELGHRGARVRARGDGRRAGRHRGEAAAGLGAAGPGRLARRAAARGARRAPLGRGQPRPGHRHRHRLHRVHRAAHRQRTARRCASCPGCAGAPARLPQAVEAPRRPAAGRPDQRAGARARRAVDRPLRRADLLRVAVRQGRSSCSSEDPEIYAARGALDRGRGLDHLAALPAPRPATPAPPATRASTRTARYPSAGLPRARSTRGSPTSRRTSSSTRSAARRPGRRRSPRRRPRGPGCPRASRWRSATSTRTSPPPAAAAAGPGPDGRDHGHVDLPRDERRPARPRCRACAAWWTAASSPGLWGYEAGQSGVGDIFGWFVDQRRAAAQYAERGRRRGESRCTSYLSDAAARPSRSARTG